MEVKFYEDAEDKLLEFAVLTDAQFTFDFYILICYNWGNRYLARDRRNIP